MRRSAFFGHVWAVTVTFADHSKLGDRSRTYGMSNKTRVLVCLTERRSGIRIISARKTMRYEKDIYENF